LIWEVGTKNRQSRSTWWWKYWWSNYLNYQLLFDKNLFWVKEKWGENVSKRIKFSQVSWMRGVETIGELGFLPSHGTKTGTKRQRTDITKKTQQKTKPRKMKSITYIFVTLSCFAMNILAFAYRPFFQATKGSGLLKTLSGIFFPSTSLKPLQMVLNVFKFKFNSLIISNYF